MSAKVLREIPVEVTSGAAQVNSDAIRLGANPWDVQFTLAPDSICLVEGSNDKLIWETMTDMFNVPISGVGEVMRVGLERPKWIRFGVGIDASQPRKFSAIFAIGKEQGS